MAEGHPYSQIKKVYSVNIVYFDLGQGDDYVYHGTTAFTGIHSKRELELSEKQKAFFKRTSFFSIIYIMLSIFAKIASAEPPVFFLRG